MPLTDQFPHPPMYVVRSSRSTGKGVEGLARVGSRAALSFAFAFLRRAWRSGTCAPRVLFPATSGVVGSFLTSATTCPWVDPMCSLGLIFLVCKMRGFTVCLTLQACASKKKGAYAHTSQVNHRSASVLIYFLGEPEIRIAHMRVIK